MNNLVVKLVNISKTYPPNVVALSNIDLEIRKGEFVSVVGKSGAGKTTLAKLLIGEEKPSSGKMEVLNWQVANFSKRDLSYYRRQIGVIFQDFKLLERKTVYENVAFALMVCETPNKNIRKTVPQILSMVGLSGKEKRFPDELSGGEQQRLAIARSLVHHPKLLIADELTGNLDALYAWEIVEILLRVNELGTSVVLFTHDRDIVNRLKRRVVTLEEGKIIRDQKTGGYMI